MVRIYLRAHATELHVNISKQSRIFADLIEIELNCLYNE